MMKLMRRLVGWRQDEREFADSYGVRYRLDKTAYEACLVAASLWEGADPEDFDLNDEYLRGQVELISDLGGVLIVGPEVDSDCKKALIREALCQMVLGERERQGGKA